MLRLQGSERSNSKRNCFETHFHFFLCENIFFALTIQLNIYIYIYRLSNLNDFDHKIT